jgi:hypothetical protein
MESIKGIPADTSREQLQYFIETAYSVRQEYNSKRSIDRNTAEHIDRDGYYCGQYTPERDYYTRMKALVVSLFKVDSNSFKIDRFSANDPENQYLEFMDQMQYLTNLCEFRLDGVDGVIVPSGLVFSFTNDFKDEISEIVVNARNIINEKVLDESKREHLLKLLRDIQECIDNDRVKLSSLVGLVNEGLRAAKEIGQSFVPLFANIQNIVLSGLASAKPRIAASAKLEISNDTRHIKAEASISYDEDIPF